MKPASSFSALTLMLCLAVGTATTVGCASQNDEESSGAANDLSLSEVVPDGAEALLVNQRPSDDARASLAIESWNVYSANDAAKGVSGSAAYATDANGDVAYVVYAAASSASEGQASFAIVRYDAAGPAADQTISDDARATLLAEVGRLGQLISDQSEQGGIRTQTTRGENTAWCAAGIAGALLVGASIHGGAALAATLVAPVAAVSMTEILVTAAIVSVVVPSLAVGVEAARERSFAVVKTAARYAWKGTKFVVVGTGKACVSAVTGH